MPRDLERFLAEEPLFAVLNAARYRTENLTAAVVSEFFDTGATYVADLMKKCDPSISMQSILEFGCGPGRLAIPFARRVPRVVAVDESPAMLEAARHFADELGARNIELLGTDAFSRSDERFDLVNCYLVLQRVPEREGLKMIRMLLGHVGQIGVFHLPFRDSSSRAAKLTRRLRLQSAAANRLANLILRKPQTTPLIRATVYDLNRVLEIFDELGFRSLELITSSEHLNSATLVVRRSTQFPTEQEQQGTVQNHGDPTSPEPANIDVRQLMAATSLHEWNRRAEEYFATLSNWQHHLAKPFSRTDEAPALLINLAVLLQGVRLLPGETVLDFGAGTGWLSRYLTQLGCRTILLDVSATALKIAAETYRRIPVLGDRPEPVYLLFDGRRIELPDQSVDHIVCFDAFHHAPNPEEILREFGRILKPGGSAGFAEPGPTHSQMPQSQFEMRTYGVLENDIDLPALWPVARESGFTDLRVAAFNIPPFLVSLQEFHDLLDGGATFKQWADSTRDFLRHVRNFVLMKGDVAGRDSRRVEGLRAEIAAEILREPNKDSLSLRATVTNAGTSVWLPSTDSPGAVWLGVHLYDTAGRLLNFELARAPISASDVAPDQIVELELDLPPLPPGECILELDCVAEQVTWFSQVGSPTTTIRVTGG